MKRRKTKKNDFDFYPLILKELERINNGKIIPFPDVYHRLGSIFHLSKDKANNLLLVLEEKKYIQIHTFRGISIRKYR